MSNLLAKNFNRNYVNVFICVRNPLQFKRRRERDIFKRDESGTGYCLIGIEAQSHNDYGMLLRSFEYDVREYLRQLANLRYENRKTMVKGSPEYISGIKKEDRLNPVVTIVLYFSW